MPKKQPELTQGRSIPKRLKHLEQGVSNWGKRWSKSPKKTTSTSTSTGGEYNTFPVSGTTSDFSVESSNASQSSFSLSPSHGSIRDGASTPSSFAGGSGDHLQPPMWHSGPSRPHTTSSRARPIRVDPNYVYLRSSQDSTSPYTSTPSPIPSSGPHTPSSMASPLSPSSTSGPSSWGSIHSTNPSTTLSRDTSVRSSQPSERLSSNEYEDIFIFEQDGDSQGPLLISGFTDVPWDSRSIGPGCTSSTMLPLTAFESSTTPQRASPTHASQQPMTESNAELNTTFPMFGTTDMNSWPSYSTPMEQLLPPAASNSSTPSPAAQRTSLPRTHIRSSYTPEYLPPPSAPPPQSSPNYGQYALSQSPSNVTQGSSLEMQHQSALAQSSAGSYDYLSVPQATQAMQPSPTSAASGTAYTPAYVLPQAQCNGSSSSRSMDGNGANLNGYQQVYAAPPIDPRHSHTTYAYHPSYHHPYYHPYRR